MSRVTKPDPDPEPERYYVREWTPPVREPDVNPDPDWLRDTLDKLYQKFGVPVKAERPKLAPLIKRCPKCEVGNFKHNGVTYCLTCYQRL